MRRSLLGTVVIAAAIAAVAAGSLSACTSPAPPRLTAAQKCTPKTAKVSWGDPVQGDKVPIEAHLLAYDGGVAVSTPVPVAADTNASVTFTSGRLGDISKVSVDSWLASLRAGVVAAGQVPSGFGDGKPVQPSDLKPSRAGGKYFVVTEEKLTTVPFTISCAGEKKLTGRIAAVADTGSYSTISRCGTASTLVPGEIAALMGPACTKA